MKRKQKHKKNDLVYVADIEFTFGTILKCFVWSIEEDKDKDKIISLREYLDKPRELLKFEKLHIESGETSLDINTKDIKNIKLKGLK